MGRVVVGRHGVVGVSGRAWGGRTIRLNLKSAHVDGHVLLTDTQETAYPDHQSVYLAVLVEQNVGHTADLGIVGAEHISALEPREHPLVRTLSLNELRAFGLAHMALGIRGICRRVALR